MSFPIILPNFDPNIISFGFIAIRWYSLAYILGIVITWFFIKKYRQDIGLVDNKALDSWLTWAIFGIIIGGRLGYVLFYNLPFYISNPLKIFAVWNGGMSFHGGLLGSIIAMYFFCRKYDINFLRLCDHLSVIAPIGLFFGRVANFINMELYGRPTGSNYGVIFPNIDYLPRHPSQLYEALLEGLLSFVIILILYKYTKIKTSYGILSAIFLILYSTSRIFVEFFREPDENLGLFFGLNITMGQILTIPILLVGIVLISKRLRSQIR